MWIGVQIKGDPTKNQKKLKSKEGDRGLLFGTEEYKSQSFYKDKGKCWGNYQINDLVVFNDFKGSDYQLMSVKNKPHKCELFNVSHHFIHKKC